MTALDISCPAQGTYLSSLNRLGRGDGDEVCSYLSICRLLYSASPSSSPVIQHYHRTLAFMQFASGLCGSGCAPERAL